MKRIIKFSVFIFLICLYVISSCKKVGSPGLRPVANAGSDITIILPVDNTELKATASDADGSIVSYFWSQVLGPSSAMIESPGDSVTKVKNLVAGVYEFELRVADNGGLSAKDTVAVLVAHASGTEPQWIPVGRLSIPRFGVAVATAGGKIFFAGGYGGVGGGIHATVDIYDVDTETWSVMQLSEARTGIAGVTAGNKVLFAGGAKDFNYDYSWHNSTSRVDIYDITTDTWTTTELPKPLHFFFDQTAGVVGNKVFFAGRQNLDVADQVYIYDVLANQWSSALLNPPRFHHSIASVGNKVLISGGRSFNGFLNNVDIYDAATDSWSVEYLSDPRSMPRVTTLNNKVFIAGGEGLNSNKVDIFDNDSQTWSVKLLSGSVFFSGAAAAGNRAIFFGDNFLDIYDASTDTWTHTGSPQPYSDYASFIGAEGHVYAFYGDVVWRLQF